VDAAAKVLLELHDSDPSRRMLRFYQGYCLTGAGRLEDGGEVDQSDSVAYFPEDREAGFVLLSTGKPRSAAHPDASGDEDAGASQAEGAAGALFVK
jgi:hypothetical protein